MLSLENIRSKSCMLFSGIMQMYQKLLDIYNMALGFNDYILNYLIIIDRLNFENYVWNDYIPSFTLT
jgi:hypothetical protein